MARMALNSTELMYKGLLFDEGLSQKMLADKLGTKGPYISMYITSRGSLPREDWQKIHDYFHELRAKK